MKHLLFAIYLLSVLGPISSTSLAKISSDKEVSYFCDPNNMTDDCHHL